MWNHISYKEFQNTIVLLHNVTDRILPTDCSHEVEELHRYVAINTPAGQLSEDLTFCGLAISMTCVMAAGGRMGLYTGRSDAEAGCNFTFMLCNNK